MDIRIYETYDELSKDAAELVKDQLRLKPDMLLCAATGNSPLGMYEVLSASGKDLFRKMRLLMLDEWLGVPEAHEASCMAYLQKNLTEPLGISDDRFFRFRSDAADPEAECFSMQETLKIQGPPDLLILGVGLNGHLGFNEPGEVLCPRPHVAHLQEKTQAHSMVSALSKAPERGLTLGMGNILMAKKILLIINGAHKQRVFSQLIQKEVSTHFPASFLWLHDQVTLLADKEVAGDISLNELFF